METFTNKLYYKKNHFILLKTIFLLFLFLDFYLGLAQNKTIIKTEKDDDLIKGYAYSNGNSVILFDASNIKQFWTDKSVVATNNNIEISLSKGSSISFKVQLANVLETQSCKVDVLSEENELHFSIKNNKLEKLGESSMGDSFINYHVSSLSFPLEATDDFSFNISFSSTISERVRIKAIILSFSDNKDSAYLGSQGFAVLENEIETKGISLSNAAPQFSSIKYLISEQYNKIFIRIPSEVALSNRYFYHVVPSSSDNLLPGREKNKFNNYDFLSTTKFLFIPRPYSASKEFSIIQRDLPKYEFKSLRLGQYNTTGQLWVIELK